jgi:hypothetical protein
MCSLVAEMNLPYSLIDDLGQSLPTPARDAFQRAALAATVGLAVVCPGNLYRVLVPLQLDHFVPPSDERASWDITQTKFTGKLLDGPPIEHARLGPRGRPLRGAVWRLQKFFERC